MFRVATLDFANLPHTPEGKVDFTRDFFGRETLLTVLGRLNVEAADFAWGVWGDGTAYQRSGAGVA